MGSRWPSSACHVPDSGVCLLPTSSRQFNSAQSLRFVALQLALTSGFEVRGFATNSFNLIFDKGASKRG